MKDSRSDESSLVDLVTSCYESWKSTASWSAVPTFDAAIHLECTVKGSLQWINLEYFGTIFITDRYVFLRGHGALTQVFGHHSDVDSIEERVGHRFVRCPSRKWLGGEGKRTALDFVAEPARLDDVLRAEIFAIPHRPDELGVLTPSGSVAIATRLGTERIVSVGDRSGSFYADIRYDEGSIPPIPFLDDTLDYREVLMMELAVRGGGIAPGVHPTSSIRIEILPPGSSEEPWCARGTGLTTMHWPTAGDVEVAFQEYLAGQDPALLDVIQFDSYEEVFLAYAWDEDSVRRVESALRGFVTAN